MARLIWTAKALADLERLLQFIEKDAPVAARRFAQRVFDRVEQLQQFPHLGGFVAEDDLRRYREILQGSYRLIYRVEGETIYIVAVHHAARLLDVTDLD
ncbi:MAG: type II toxin-antitoxin system RelE/ParE family toxin [Planctomycetota bacterium]|nr:MAG: type II toxin-antitoxin system RelE/ParE family toxin [Planctomycetota bacterium]